MSNISFKEHLKSYLDDKEIEKLVFSLSEKRTFYLLLNYQKTTKNVLKNYYFSQKPHFLVENLFEYDGEIDKPGKSFLFDNGAYYIMDSSSTLISHFLKFDDNDYVLDMCAAPGGKSISIALKNPKINLISNDINYPRSVLLSQNIERLGLSNVIVTCNNLSTIYKNYLNTFDKIILDAPCSGSGMFRKSEEMEKDWTYNKVLKQSSIQKELIEIAYSMLKPGGILSYSTCSFSYEENEEIIEFLLNNHNEAKLISIPHFEGEFRSKNLPEAIHLLPSHFKGEGMFICFIQKGNNENISTTSKKNRNLKVFKNKTKYPELSNFKYEYIKNDEIYLTNNVLDLSKFNVISYGLNIGKNIKNNFIPSFHLAHYLSSENSIELTDEEFKKYIHGDTFKKEDKNKNDFYVVSYNGINLGFSKRVDGVYKNFYPKGLRH